MADKKRFSKADIYGADGHTGEVASVEEQTIENNIIAPEDTPHEKNADSGKLEVKADKTMIFGAIILVIAVTFAINLID